MINLQIDINAPRSYVWICMMNKTSVWWAKEFYTSPYTKKMVFDGKIGGHLYEDFGNEQGVIWADIIAIRSGEFINMRGQLAPEFGGPNISFNKIVLEATADESCRLHFSEHWMVEKDAKFIDSMKEGWHAILSGLKNLAEKK